MFLVIEVTDVVQEFFVLGFKLGELLATRFGFDFVWDEFA